MFEAILTSHIGDQNNSETHKKIGDKFRKQLQSIQDKGAISEYTVICDETNNSREIVDTGTLAINYAFKFKPNLTLWKVSMLFTPDMIITTPENFGFKFITPQKKS
jgi:hypothetical protein